VVRKKCRVSVGAGRIRWWRLFFGRIHASDICSGIDERKMALGVRHVDSSRMLDMFIYGPSRAESPRDGSAQSFACGTALSWAASGTFFCTLIHFYLVSVLFWYPCRESVVMHNSGQSNRLRSH
jgi:hypothetical protein